jgi:hypothetical protein
MVVIMKNGVNEISRIFYSNHNDSFAFNGKGFIITGENRV